MGFDLKKFRKAKFKPRTQKLPLFSDTYGEFFNEGDERAFVLRGLEGEELFFVNEAEQNASIQKKAMEILSSPAFKNEDAIKELAGKSENPTATYCKAIEAVRIGMFDPAMELQDVVLFAKTSSVDFKNAFHIIMNLSGKGMVVGEPPASGKTPKSKQPSTSAMPEASSSTK